MFQGEKTLIFWIGLIILGLASTALFTIIWWAFVYSPCGIIHDRLLLALIPPIVGTLVFIIIGLYIMNSGVKKKEQEREIQLLKEQ